MENTVGHNKTAIFSELYSNDQKNESNWDLKIQSQDLDMIAYLIAYKANVSFGTNLEQLDILIDTGSSVIYFMQSEIIKFIVDMDWIKWLL